MRGRRAILVAALWLGGCPADVSLPEVTGGPSTGSGAGGTAPGTGGAPQGDCSSLDDACGVGSLVDGACARKPRPDGTVCDDGLTCTSFDHCSGGICTAGAPAECAVGAQCKVATCDEVSGTCLLMPAADGTPCEDADPCSGSSACMGGACVGADPVSCPIAFNLCYRNECEPGVGCVRVPQNADAPCNFWPGDGTLAEGECFESRCDDTGYCSKRPIRQGLPCSAQGCALSATCQAKECVADSFAADLTPCDDGSACTTGERCFGEVCSFGVGVPCPSLAASCLSNACDSALGACVPSFPTELFPLFGEPCEHPSECRGAGSCVDAATCNAPAVNDGGSCDDGLACTTNELCGAGNCLGTPVTQCVTGDGCCPSACSAASDGDCRALVYMASTVAKPGFFVGGHEDPGDSDAISRGLRDALRPAARSAFSGAS